MTRFLAHLLLFVGRPLIYLLFALTLFLAISHAVQGVFDLCR